MPLDKQATVKFDPAKKEHRAAVAAFLRRRAWNDSPLRFTDDPAYGSVAEQVEKKMLAYYLSKDKLVIPEPVNTPLMVGSITDSSVKTIPRVRAANDEKPVGLTIVSPHGNDIRV